MNFDLICFSHLRWNFVYQRPQHLLSRAAKEVRVYFIEEPVFKPGVATLEIRRDDLCGTIVVVPVLPEHLDDRMQNALLKTLVDQLLIRESVRKFVSWYYTPMALKFTRHLKPLAAVYDCMDQLSHFKGAPKEISVLERELFTKVDVVFTGGRSLYEAKKNMHPNVHAFPSSVDVNHFKSARNIRDEPIDQAVIKGPKLGYIGVIDERIDLDLIAGLAELRPHWQIIMIGPVVKIDPATLPRRDNIHYLGGKSYQDLPAYLSGWDVALMPFAKNDATKYISPTKTPEYLAGGCPVVSTSIGDVVSPYGDLGLVYIADSASEFVSGIEGYLDGDFDRDSWTESADMFLSKISWNITFESMWDLVWEAASHETLISEKANILASSKVSVPSAHL